MSPHKKMAEAVRFELTVPFSTPVFKTGTLNHSVTLPYQKSTNCSCNYITQLHCRTKRSSENNDGNNSNYKIYLQNI
tara:strand:- start:1212 stop:1442 length:231 start_codon:yes stop_codon:yes gene_type:complete